MDKPKDLEHNHALPETSSHNHSEVAVQLVADRIVEALQRHRYLILFLFSVLYFLATCYRASKKLFWFDELFTVYLSRLPDMAAIWDAVKHGANFNPPLFYALTRLSQSVFGEGPIGTRLPEIIGFWIFCLCLFWFVSARVSFLAGLISMSFPLVTTAYFYAYEARPHGIVLGFAGIALVCYSRACVVEKRIGWVAGMSAALLGAILTHTYALLLLAPFAFSEGMRSLVRRRIDLRFWLAIAASSLGVLVYLPLLQASKFFPRAFWPADIRFLVSSYQYHLAPAAGAIAVALVVFFAFGYLSLRNPLVKRDAKSLAWPEAVLLLAFVVMPVLCFLLARLTHAPLLHRYSVSSVAAFACVFGIAMARRPAAGLGVLIVLGTQIGFDLSEFRHSKLLTEPSSSTLLEPMPGLNDRYEAIRAFPDKTVPVALLDNLDFLPMIFYAPADIRSRLVYFGAGPETDLTGEAYALLIKCCGVAGRFEKLADTVSNHDHFVVVISSKSTSKLNELIRQGAEVKVESVLWTSALASVNFKKRQGDR